MENIEKEGISLSDIFKLIWKRKILVGIITGITLILTVLLIVLLYNPNKITYTTDFSLSFSGSQEDLYPTGEIFNYKDIVSKDKLLAVKESNEKYNEINIDELYEKDAFKIARVEDESVSNNVLSNDYQLVVSKSKVLDEKLMADFIKDLVSLTINDIEVKSQKTNYVEDLKKYEDYTVYKDAITYLIEETKVILDGYDKLIKKYGDAYTINDKTLKSYQSEAKTTLNNLSLNYYLATAEENLYVTNQEALDSFEEYANSKIADLIRQKTLNDYIIKEYRNVGLTGSDFTEEMSKIALSNAEIIIELEALCVDYSNDDDSSNDDFTAKSASIASQDFKSKLDKAYKSVLSIMETFETNVRTSNLNSIVLNYELNAIVNASGDINIVVSILAGAVIGLIIGSIVALISELPKLNKKKDEAQVA